MTQKEKVYEFMVENDGITQFDALREFGCMRLASRISDLKKEGTLIKTEIIKSKNRKGETVRFAKYFLVEKE